jgi:hypothetical protein
MRRLVVRIIPSEAELLETSLCRDLVFTVGAFIARAIIVDDVAGPGAAGLAGIRWANRPEFGIAITIAGFPLVQNRAASTGAATHQRTNQNSPDNYYQSSITHRQSPSKFHVL